MNFRGSEINKDSIYKEWETKRLYLRVLSPSAALQSLSYYKRNIEILKKYEPTYPEGFFTVDFQESILSIACKKYDKKKNLSLFIFKKENPLVPIGHISLFNIKKGAHRGGELGYKIDKELWNKGYATEAIKKVLELGFDDFDLERIEAFVAGDNLASARVLTKNGFEFEGIRRHHVFLGGRWRNYEVYSIINS